MGAGLAPVQEAATVPRADLPPQSVLKGVLCSGHGLVHVADLGQGHLAEDLQGRRALKPSGPPGRPRGGRPGSFGGERPEGGAVFPRPLGSSPPRPQTGQQMQTAAQRL